MEKNTLIRYFRQAASILKDSKLRDLKGLEPNLDEIRKAMSLRTNDEATVLVGIMDRQCSNESSDMSDLAEYFDCTSLDMMEYVPSAKWLQEKGYIKAENITEFNFTKMKFKLSSNVFNSVIEGSEFVLGGYDRTKFDQFDFFKTIHNIISERRFNRIDTPTLISQTLAFEEMHKDLRYVINLKALVSEVEARILFCEMCFDFQDDKDGEIGCYSGINPTLSDIYDRRMEFTRVKREFIQGVHALQRAGLGELRKDVIVITDKGLELMYEENASVYIKNRSGLDRFTFVQEIHQIVKDLPGTPCRSDIIGLRKDVLKIEEKNDQLEFIDELSSNVDDVYDRTIFYLICYELINSEEYWLRQLSDISEKKDEMVLRRQFKSCSHELQRTGLVELSTKGGMFDNTSLVLTDKGKKLYLEEDVDLFETVVTDKNIITCDKITEKKLFFSDELERQLNTLKFSLTQGNYEALRERLEKEKLPKGIAVLLYGYPGTGKTESVKQLARLTGRSIMHVDISATKTCWFGESEKLIKKVFDNYRTACERSKVTPILLFNEADGIFAKRKDTNFSSVSQTENAIQNIILEEMENLDGILIATTNLADNLDKAFERRFLFKIKYDKPTVEAKKNIWLSKLPTLDDNTADKLATMFDFSGGEIDNISRKVVMEELIKGEKISRDTLITLCKEEKMGSNGNRKIGYC